MIVSHIIITHIHTIWHVSITLFTITTITCSTCKRSHIIRNIVTFSFLKYCTIYTRIGHIPMSANLLVYTILTFPVHMNCMINIFDVSWHHMSWIINWIWLHCMAKIRNISVFPGCILLQPSYSYFAYVFESHIWFNNSTMTRLSYFF